MAKKTLALGLLSLLPLVSYAQTFNLSPLQSLIGALARLIGSLIPILITLALVVFFWGLVRYLFYGKSEPDIVSAKKLMGWGLIILFVMVSVWGIIALAQTALEIDPNARGQAPQIQYSGASTVGNTPTSPAAQASYPPGGY